jgi:hypothetical protein
MATTTPNFGWAVPTSTDLVKDGAVAIETLGDSIDASLVDLKGGTTGQVLAKASGTDMDFSWVTDATGIPATIFDAKGDIIAATAADTASRLAVGANNTVLTADSSTATGLKWATPATGGGMTLLSTTSLSGATTSLTTISGAYVNLQLFIVDFYASSASTLTIQVNSQTANYANIVVLTSDVTSNTVPGLTSTMRCTNESAVGTSSTNNNIALTFPNYAASSSQKIGHAFSSYTGSGGDKIIENGTSRLPITGALTQIDIKTSAGTWSGGTAYLYGVK